MMARFNGTLIKCFLLPLLLSASPAGPAAFDLKVASLEPRLVNRPRGRQPWAANRYCPAIGQTSSVRARILRRKLRRCGCDARDVTRFHWHIESIRGGKFDSL